MEHCLSHIKFLQLLTQFCSPLPCEKRNKSQHTRDCGVSDVQERSAGKAINVHVRCFCQVVLESCMTSQVKPLAVQTRRCSSL